MNNCPFCGKPAGVSDEYVVRTSWKRRQVTEYFHYACYEKITRRAVNERVSK